MTRYEAKIAISHLAYREPLLSSGARNTTVTSSSLPPLNPSRAGARLHYVDRLIPERLERLLQVRTLSKCVFEQNIRIEV